MAIAGVLVAAPQAHAAAGQAAEATTAVVQIRTDALLTHDAPAAQQEPARRYTVRRGDTLSSIAQRFYGSAAGWSQLYQASRSVLHNPDMIFPGQVLGIPGHHHGQHLGPHQPYRADLLNDAERNPELRRARAAVGTGGRLSHRGCHGRLGRHG